MAFDAYLLFTQAATNNSAITPQGESLIAQNAITLAESWGFGVENKLNIKTTTQGGASGKAEFQEFKIKKAVDKASTNMYLALCQGLVFNGVFLVLQKSVGTSGAAAAQSTSPYLIWEFNMFMVEKIDWSHADDEPEEEVTFKFGSCQMSYSQQTQQGKLLAALTTSWDQLSNSKTPTPDFPKWSQPPKGQPAS
jgi:type VI secretion system secreted protein Hcp